MLDLSKIIQVLIDSGKEGDYWDFKVKHHDKPGDLVKDIICLANAMSHCGDRYLIFGVDDTCSVEGVAQKNRRSQADIINTLAQAGFAAGRYPDVHLETIAINGKEVDILIIKDLPESHIILRKNTTIAA